MKKFISILTFLLCASLAVSGWKSPSPNIAQANQDSAQVKSVLPIPKKPASKSADRIRINKTYVKLPLRFETNVGQSDEQVKFLSRGKGYSIFFTPAEAVLALIRKKSEDRKSGFQTSVLRMALKDSNPDTKISGEEKLASKSNYIKGNDPKKWHYGVTNYRKVRYKEVYPGIDLVYYGNQKKLEYDFIVQPGVDPKAIQIGFQGANEIEIDEDGDLNIHLAGGQVFFHAPVIYQEIDGKRKSVSGNYVLTDDDKVAFALGQYDTTEPLIIEPVLGFSNFLSGETLAHKGVPRHENNNSSKGNK